MHIVFSNHKLPTSVRKSLFLAGPSPRALDVADWRHEALALLRELGYDGTVFVPIPDFRFVGEDLDDGKHGWTYDNQVQWEVEARKMSDVHVFWVPRTIDRSREDLGMPAFTTNFEMGEDLRSGRLVYGRPDWAVKCKYLDERVGDVGETAHNDLRGLLVHAMSYLGEGAYREGGETRVPLNIWRSEAFEGWYANLKRAGNRLDDAELFNAVFVGPKRVLFTFTLKVNIWVESEQRHKSNEVIIGRKDVSSVFAFHVADGVTHVALVREFRSTVNNPKGFVYELPGGSSAKVGEHPLKCAQDELHEEMGLSLDIERIREVGQRQLNATFSTHRARVFAAKLNAEEFAYLERAEAERRVFGEGDSERTEVVLTTLQGIRDLPVDYATLGMVYEAASELGLLG